MILPQIPFSSKPFTPIFLVNMQKRKLLPCIRPRFLADVLDWKIIKNTRNARILLICRSAKHTVQQHIISLKKKCISMCKQWSELFNNNYHVSFVLYKKRNKKSCINHISVYENIVSVSLETKLFFHSCSKIGRNCLEKKR